MSKKHAEKAKRYAKCYSISYVKTRPEEKKNTKQPKVK